MDEELEGKAPVLKAKPVSDRQKERMKERARREAAREAQVTMGEDLPPLSQVQPPREVREAQRAAVVSEAEAGLKKVRRNLSQVGLKREKMDAAASPGRLRIRMEKLARTLHRRLAGVELAEISVKLVEIEDLVAQMRSRLERGGSGPRNQGKLLLSMNWHELRALAREQGIPGLQTMSRERVEAELRQRGYA